MEIFYSNEYKRKSYSNILEQNKTEDLSCSEKLLKKVLLKKLQNPFLLKRGLHGYPYIEGDPNLNISITHTGKYWICALDSYNIGIDAEFYDRKLSDESKLAKRFFTKEEYLFLNKIESADIRKRSFIRMWTMKEAALKVKKTGIAGKLNSIEVVKSGKLLKKIEGLNFYSLNHPFESELCVTVCRSDYMENKHTFKDLDQFETLTDFNLPLLMETNYIRII